MLAGEGAHAAWQWLEHKRRGMKLPQVSAALKIQDYLAQFQDSPDELPEHFRRIQRAVNRVYTELLRTGTIETGMRQAHLYAKRYNMSPVDVDILKDQVEPREERLCRWES